MFCVFFLCDIGQVLNFNNSYRIRWLVQFSNVVSVDA